MVVLPLFRYRFMTYLHCLLRTEMYTGQALCTMVADVGFFVLNDDVLLRTDFGADTTANAFIRVHMLAYGGDADRLHGAGVHDGTHRRTFGVLQVVLAGLDVRRHLFQQRRDGLQLFELVVGIVVHRGCAAVGHRDDAAVGNRSAVFLHALLHRKDGISRGAATSGNNKHVGLLVEYE